jgi:hypothetical protein
MSEQTASGGQNPRPEARAIWCDGNKNKPRWEETDVGHFRLEHEPIATVKLGRRQAFLSRFVTEVEEIKLETVANGCVVTSIGWHAMTEIRQTN